MPLDKLHPALTILPLPTPFHIHQYPPTTPLPKWASVGDDTDLSFLSITKTSEELSIVYSRDNRIHQDDPTSSASSSSTLKKGVEKRVENRDVGAEKGKYEGPWRCLKVRGPMELDMTGVMYALTSPLKIAQVPVFAISTWNTDYVLTPWEKTEEAVEALRNDGWVVESREE